MYLKINLFFLLATFGLTFGEIHFVENSDEFREALKNIEPGDTIQLADGVYSGGFEINRQLEGYAYLKPKLITTIKGSPRAIIENRNNFAPAIFVNHSYLKLKLVGFHIQNAVFGILIKNSHVICENLEIKNIDRVGIETMNEYSEFILTKTTIKNIGTKSQLGIGLKISLPEQDSYVQRNEIVGNQFGPGISGVGIQTNNTDTILLSYNTFYGRGRNDKLASGLGCWVDSKAKRFWLYSNVGEGCSEDGFVIRGNSSYLSDVIIEQNSCYFKLKKDEKKSQGRFCVNVADIANKTYAIEFKSNIVEGGQNLTNLIEYYDSDRMNTTTTSTLSTTTANYNYTLNNYNNGSNYDYNFYNYNNDRSNDYNFNNGSNNDYNYNNGTTNYYSFGNGTYRDASNNTFTRNFNNGSFTNDYNNFNDNQTNFDIGNVNYNFNNSSFTEGNGYNYNMTNNQNEISNGTVFYG